MKTCPNCKERNSFWRVHCVACKHALKPTPEERATKPADVDDGFDSLGFAIGMATGLPLSPSHGLSIGSMLGAALHADHLHKPAQASEAPDTFTTPAPEPAPAPVSSEPTEPSRVPDAEPSYSEPSRVPDAAPSYSAPEPSYSAPEPSYSAPDTSTSSSE